MDWRGVPSLSALRAFEAAIRLGSLSEAARTLNVTHAAISQHLRTLEAEFAIPLVQRGPAGIAPTDAGRILAGALAEGFGAIADGIDAVRAEVAGRPLVVSSTPTFAETWLMPRLGGFWSAHPGIEIALRPSNEVIDVPGGAADMAIRYGRGDWPKVTSDRLAAANFVVVAAPGFDEGGMSLARRRWFFDFYGIEYRQWALQQGLTDADTEVSPLATNTLVLAAVRAGFGLTAQTRANVERDLEAGTLVALREIADPTVGYFIVTRPGDRPERLATFIDWLKSVA